MQSVVSVLYYAATALIALVLLANVLRTKDVKKTVLYATVLIPFVLRLARIK